jgi:Bacterial protein of unknown function (DUF882)
VHAITVAVAPLDRLLSPLLAATLTALVATPTIADPANGLHHTTEARWRKGMPDVSAALLRGTLVDTHSPVRLPLSDVEPDPLRFGALVRDPVTFTTREINPALLDLVRQLLKAHEGASVELVSGYRSPKLNEALRKKGHHVASHSQHPLGQALDFRIVPVDSDTPLDPEAVAKEIRALSWPGGVGIYLGAADRFVHADAGPLRTWYGQ